ncbi:thioesterase domain-containing protein [Micromonospora sagamiensis]|uniref:Thioesterase domain-containing protein n=1 Tax=Micromonospora sagamiensis TaxID=47875 RepID=A0A562WJS2_9ACTN|nr:alpha/beta fold hydrolase [Micromonospora sagamiensis]TWJ30398.1 thioesterase domain-containing protein [Micromonospora sagamiensis]
MTDRAVLTIRATGHRPPLCCVPAISGSPYPYLPLRALVEADQPVLALEAPGFDDGRPPAGSLPELAAGYLDSLRRARPDRAYALLGWSMGGVVAYHLAQRLRAAGFGVPALVLVDSIVPTLLRHPEGLARTTRFVVDLLATSGQPVEPARAVLAGLPAGSTPEGAFTALSRAGVLPDDLDHSFLLHRYALFDAHLTALSRYRPTGGYDGPVTLVRAADSSAELMRWDGLATDVTEIVVPGDHYSIWRGEGLAALGRALRRCLSTTYDDRGRPYARKGTADACPPPPGGA